MNNCLNSTESNNEWAFWTETLGSGSPPKGLHYQHEAPLQCCLFELQRNHGAGTMDGICQARLAAMTTLREGVLTRSALEDRTRVRLVSLFRAGFQASQVLPTAGRGRIRLAVGLAEAAGACGAVPRCCASLFCLLFNEVWAGRSSTSTRCQCSR